MVNTNIQGAIPIVGQGFVAKRHGDYSPGEFKRLTNVELHENIIKNRRNIKSALGTAGTTVNPIVNPFGFIGKLKDYVLMATETRQIAVNQSGTAELWAPTQLPVPAEAGSFHKVLSYFRYNNINYWLTLEFRANNHIKVALYYGNINVNNDIPDSYGTGYFVSLTRVDVLTVPLADPNYNKFEFCNAFIHGDRLWLVTSVGLYFSKPADFTVFTSPDGGFFKLPDRVINHAISLRDSIYVLCDDSIHVLTYSADPNIDGTMRRIADNMGGDHGCVYGDVPYFVNQVGIYRINNNFVEKILDNEFDLGIDYYNNKLAPFEDYIILLKYLPVNYEKYDGLTTTVRTNRMTNPSFETAFTGFVGDTLYMQKSRSNEKAFAGAWSHKTKKITDNTLIDRRNTFTNPSCEVNTSGWTIQNGTLSQGELFYEGPHYPQGGGAHSLRIDVIASGGTTKASYQVLNAWPTDVGLHDINFRFSRRYAGEITVNNMGRPVVSDFLCQVIWHDAAGNNLGTDDVIGSLCQGYNDKAWKVFVTSVEAPVGTRGYTLEFKELGVLGSDFALWLDTIIVEDQTNMFGVIEDTDKYFDGSTTNANGYIYEWVGTPGLSASTRRGNNPGPDIDRKYILDYSGLVNSGVTVSGGKSYTIGAAVYADVNAHNLQFDIRQYNAANVLLGQTIVDAGPNPVVDQWKYVTAQFTTDPTATYIKFFIRTTTPLSKNDVYYIDAITVELTETYNGYFDGDVPDTANVDNAWVGTANASMSTYTAVSQARRLFKNGSRFVPGLGDNSLGYNVYFINMLTGAIHVVDFRDKRDDLYHPELQGYISDIFVNNNKDVNGNFNCYFMVNSLVTDAVDSYTFHSYPYYMNSYRDTDFYDTAVKMNGKLTKYSPKVEVEIDSFVPDGNEFLMKKFRNLEIQSKLPNEHFFVKLGFDSLFGPSIPISAEPSSENNRPHYPLRIGVNQRARSLSVLLSNEEETVDYPDTTVPNELIDNEKNGAVEISALRTLWTYTGRSPTHKNVV